MLEFCAPETSVAPLRRDTIRSRMVLFCAMLVAMIIPVSALAGGPQTMDALAVKTQVRQFGIGKNVKVKLVGGQKLHGRIVGIGADSFAVKAGKRHPEAIPYSQVVLVKDPGRRVKWLMIGGAIVIVIIIIAVH